MYSMPPPMRHDMKLLYPSCVLGNEMMEGELQLALTWDPSWETPQGGA